MEFHSQILASMVYWDYHIWKDMGALHLHYIWTNVHEDSPRIQHPSGMFKTLSSHLVKYHLIMNFAIVLEWSAVWFTVYL